MAKSHSNPTNYDAWRGLLKFHARVTTAVSSRLQIETGLTLAEFEVLAHLADHPAQRLPMSELAREVVLTPSGITRMIDRLVGRGLVERQSLRSDARVKHAAITDVGRSLVARATVVQNEEVGVRFINQLSPAQIGQLREIWTSLDGVALAESSANS